MRSLARPPTPSLDLFEREPRLAQVQDISAALARGLEPYRGLPGVKDVRVLGAIGVVELERIADLARLRARFVEEGVFIRPFGTAVYLTPSFTITSEELARLTAAVVKVLGEDGVAFRRLSAHLRDTWARIEEKAIREEYVKVIMHPTARPDAIDSPKAVLLRVAQSSRTEQDCISYQVLQDPTDPRNLP
jgi:hypothetical protein